MAKDKDRWRAALNTAVKQGFDKFLPITNLKHFYMYLFISSLYMFRASQCSSSGDQIVLIHHLV